MNDYKKFINIIYKMGDLASMQRLDHDLVYEGNKERQKEKTKVCNFLLSLKNYEDVKKVAEKYEDYNEIFDISPFDMKELQKAKKERRDAEKWAWFNRDKIIELDKKISGLERDKQIIADACIKYKEKTGEDITESTLVQIIKKKCVTTDNKVEVIKGSDKLLNETEIYVNLPKATATETYVYSDGDGDVNLPNAIPNATPNATATYVYPDGNVNLPNEIPIARRIKGGRKSRKQKSKKTKKSRKSRKYKKSRK